MVTHVGPSIAVRRTRATGVDGVLHRWLSSRTRHSEASPDALPRLAPGERLLSVEADGRGGPVAATDRGIYHDDGGGWLRLGWDGPRP